LVAAVVVATYDYAAHYPPALEPAGALTFLACVVAGQGATAIKGRRQRLINPGPGSAPGPDVLKIILVWFVILLGLASVWRVDEMNTFEYRGGFRWCGPWDNPNHFGLLMGAGILLVAGLVVGKIKARSRPRGFSGNGVTAALNFAVPALGCFAALLMFRGLLHSYSRGAWCGTLVGLAFLCWRACRSPDFKLQSFPPISRILPAAWLKTRWIPVGVIVASLGLLSFWHFRDTDWHPAHRAFSAVNPVDFSWRNRLAAWEGALQITSENPWLGAGWNQPEQLYSHYYLPSKVCEGMAMQMNDYLTLGATLGIPALFCVAMCLWLSLRFFPDPRPPIPDPHPEATNPPHSLLQATCHAAAIVLLVGFWFDGGLFKLPTAATFWILLELGAVQPQNRLTAKNSKISENCAA